jgi:FMN reductase
MLAAQSGGEADMANIVAILGSVTPPGRLSSAISGALERASAAGHATELLDLGQLRLGFADGTPVEQLTDDTPRLVRTVSEADAVVLATPVYRATLTGALKNALDLLPIEALQAKPVGVVAMGATLHHFLGAESHLRDVLAWFGAWQVPSGVYLSSADFADGKLTDGAASSLDELVRALTALADVRKTLPAGPTPLAARR